LIDADQIIDLFDRSEFQNIANISKLTDVDIGNILKFTRWGISASDEECVFWTDLASLHYANMVLDYNDINPWKFSQKRQTLKLIADLWDKLVE